MSSSPPSISKSYPIDCIAIFDISSKSLESTVVFHTPASEHTLVFCERIRKSILPCSDSSCFPKLSEECTHVLTNRDGSLEYGHCLILPTVYYAVCIHSSEACFALFHALTSLIRNYELYREHNWPTLSDILTQLTARDGQYHLALPSDDIPSNFPIPMPDPCGHPFHANFILELCRSLSVENCIKLVESILVERSIVFVSTRISRIASCIIAALSLVYPFKWVHGIYTILTDRTLEYAGCPSPFVCGIHSCQLESVKKIVVPGVQFIDLDNDEFTIAMEASDSKLPNTLRKWLITRGNSSRVRVCRSNETDLQTASYRNARKLVEPFLELMIILLGGYRDAIECNDPASPTPPTDASLMQRFNSAMQLRFPNNKMVNSKSAGQLDHPHASPFDQDARPPHEAGRLRFNKATFIGKGDREFKRYLEQLCQSQMLVQFIDDRLDILNSDHTIIENDEFEDTVDQLRNSNDPQIKWLFNRNKNAFQRMLSKFPRPKLASPAVLKHKLNASIGRMKRSSSQQSPRFPLVKAHSFGYQRFSGGKTANDGEVDLCSDAGSSSPPPAKSPDPSEDHKFSSDDDEFLGMHSIAEQSRLIQTIYANQPLTGENDWVQFDTDADDNQSQHVTSAQLMLCDQQRPAVTDNLANAQPSALPRQVSSSHSNDPWSLSNDSDAVISVNLSDHQQWGETTDLVAFVVPSILDEFDPLQAK